MPFVDVTLTASGLNSFAGKDGCHLNSFWFSQFVAFQPVADNTTRDGSVPGLRYRRRRAAPVGGDSLRNDLSNGGRVSQPLYVPQRGLAEVPLVVAAKVGGVFVADPVARLGRVKTFADHQPPGLLEPQALLEL